MLVNVGFRFGNLFVAPTYKNSARRYFVAVLCTSVLFCMVQTASAELEAVTTETAITTAAYTGKVRAEGAATIGAGGRKEARQAALSDALRNAAASAGKQAMADKLPGAANASQPSLDVRPAQQGSYYSIVREWESQGIYHIAVSAEVVKGKFDAENAILVRIPIPKKKIVITQFDVANTIHVDDINNIYDGFPAALSSRLEASGEFLSSSTSRAIPIEADAPQREAIIQIAGETGAQFLISGVVVNAGTGHEKWSLDTPFNWSLKVPFGGYKKRHIEVEFSVYDGLTGSRLLSHRLGDHAEGDLAVGNSKPFGSSLFFETEFGKATSRLIDSAVKDIQEVLEKVPFSAHIIRAEGKKVYLDAGGDSLLEPGDKLVVYASSERNQIAGLNGSALGAAERATETVTLIQVKPQFSIGELPEDAVKLGIKAGNIARVNFADQRDLAAKQIAAQQLVKAQQEIKAEAERVKAEQAAQAEVARIKAEQAAQAEAARVKEEQKAQAQAAVEAKAAKLKAQKEANISRVSAAQKARTRALFIRIKAAQKAKAQAAAEAKAAKLKAQKEAKAEASRDKTEQQAPIPAEAQTATKNNTQQTVKNGAAEGKSKRKVLPPGERAVRESAKSKPKP